MAKKSDEDFVKNLNSQKWISSSFVVVSKTIRTASSGRNYIDLTLTDKTGHIKGRIFPNSNVEDVYESIISGSICKIGGNVTEFPPHSGNFNIVINNFEAVSEEECDLDDFIATSDNDQEEAVQEIRSTIKFIENYELKNLLKSFFCDEQFSVEFYKLPAAKFHHHNYRGGLLDHTIEVLKISKNLYELFPGLNKDLLYTGALLHDIGKIKAYNHDNVSIEMSEKGVLMDHLYLSGEMVKEKIDALNISDELTNQLLHIILSHHGNVSNGWGSVVNPKTPEAIALHYADLLDARVKEMFQR
jgi:3'-5' exoribonuclease